MTMNELRTIYEQHFPSAPPHQQGRAGVTTAGSVTRVTTGAPAITPWWMRPHPCFCGCGQQVFGDRMYFNNACRQRAYRQRKKAGK